MDQRLVASADQSLHFLPGGTMNCMVREVAWWFKYLVRKGFVERPIACRIFVWTVAFRSSIGAPAFVQAPARKRPSSWAGRSGGANFDAGPEKGGKQDMNGWLIIFATTSMSSGLWSSSGEAPAAVFASVLFGVLFLIALSTKAVRGVIC
jgi:hypothetical protein